MKQFFFRILMIVFVVFWVACDDKRIYEQHQEIPQKEWTYQEKFTFDVPVEDISRKYNVFINLRHTNRYPFSNLWVKMHTIYPSGKKMENRVDLPLASKDGQWYGSGSGDIVSAQIQIQNQAILPEKGNYRFEIEQDMRMNPLLEVMDVGVRLELAD